MNEEELYIKGFNAGYLLSKEDSELLESILKSANTDSIYLTAMDAGKKQRDRENFLENIKSARSSRDTGHIR